MKHKILHNVFEIVKQKDFYKKLTKENKTIIPPQIKMNYSIENYIDIISKVYKFPTNTTQFWIYVIKITWFMIASEKDHTFAINQLIDAERKENGNQ